jgi:transposase
MPTSRKLERECKTNLEAMWLLKGLTPDFKTIADFRKDNPLAIGALFKEFVASSKRTQPLWSKTSNRGRH